MGELLWDDMNAMEATWTIEKRFRVTEVFLAVLVSKSLDHGRKLIRISFNANLDS